TRPGFPLAAFAGELTDARGRLDALASADLASDVRAVFSWSCQAPREPAARMFRLLGLHPGPDVGLPAAASLAGEPIPYTRRLLEELTSAHLVTEHVPGRFVLHDLLRVYAAELTRDVDPEPDRHAARHRMLDHYLCSAHAADQWLPTQRHPLDAPAPRPGVAPESFTGNAAAREWLSTELRVLLALIDQDTDDSYVPALSRAVNTFLIWRGLWQDKITVQLAALLVARRHGDGQGEAVIHRGLAQAYERLERREEARSHAQRAYERSGELGDHTGRASALLLLVWLSERDERPQDGLRYARQCLEAARAGGDPVLQALARNAIGWCHTLLGEPEQAIVHGEQALAEPVGMCDVYSTLGNAHHQLGQHRQAVDYHRQAVDWSHRYGDRRHEAADQVNLAEAYESAGENDNARQARLRALSLYDELGHPDADKLRTRIDRTRLIPSAREPGPGLASH
ncbi:MAG: tetratricopeptide repeat protein, partial [Micromonosporaceae bacterium]